MLWGAVTLAALGAALRASPPHRLATRRNSLFRRDPERDGSPAREVQDWREKAKSLKQPYWAPPKLADAVPREYVTSASDLSNLGRSIVIVTTAAPPWMTGTAVNPALRAAYLAARGYANVTLMLPWLAEANDQRRLYGDRVFSTPSAQGQFVREWCAKNAPSGSAEFTVGWYPARYAGGIGSILGTDDITSHIPSWENDVVILEEPEHLNWYRNGPRWTTRFNHVVGVGHTNYEAYASCEPSREKSSSIDVLAERVFTETVTRAHCDVVLQLSATLRPLPHSRVCNVHGVREVFLAMGEEKAYARREFQEAKAAPCYFLGKALWAKGYDQLLLLLASADLSEIYSHVDAERLALRTAEDEAFPKMKFLESLVPALASAKEEALPAAMPVLIDCFGNGPDLCAIEAKSGELCAPLDFKGAADHALDSVFGAYDIFVNPSISEVLCTATAEALAMGKRVVISRHPSNEFFYDFERCHTFAPGDDAEFASQLLRAVRASAAERKQARAAAPPAFFKNNTLLSSIAAYSLADPKATLPGLDVAERRALSWEAATDRLVAAAALDARAAPARLALASLVMHSYHWSMTRSPLALDLFLTISGAGPHTPWERRYPQAFKALNESNVRVIELKKAAKRIRDASQVASQKFRDADARAARLRTAQASRSRRPAATPASLAARSASLAARSLPALEANASFVPDESDVAARQDAALLDAAEDEEAAFDAADATASFDVAGDLRLVGPLRVVTGPQPRKAWLAAPKKTGAQEKHFSLLRSIFARPLEKVVAFLRALLAKRPTLPRSLAAKTSRAAAAVRTGIAEKAERENQRKNPSAADGEKPLEPCDDAVE